jgi:hypothetical protein
MSEPLPAGALLLAMHEPLATARTPEGADALYSPALKLLLAELVEHIEKHGWTAEHDDAHDDATIGRAALAYALAGLAYAMDDDRSMFGKAERNWPWSAQSFHPGSELACHVKAAALHIAEANRIIRAQALLEHAR